MQGQGTNNPFDLEHRKSVEITNILEKDSVENRVTYLPKEKTDNPFDIVAAPPTQKVEHSTSQEASQSGSGIGFLFWVLLSILLFFSAIYGSTRRGISEIYNSFFNENFLRQAHRLNQSRFSLSFLLLYIFSTINIGVFIYLILVFFKLNVPQTFYFLLLLIGIFSLIVIGKHFLLWLVGSIFPISKEINLYSFTLFVFWIMVGIFLLPMNFLVAYAPPMVSKLAVYISFGVIIATLFFRAIRGISIGSKYLISNKFHFFIYLCTIEILPTIVLVKLIKNYSITFL